MAVGCGGRAPPRSACRGVLVLWVCLPAALGLYDPVNKIESARIYGNIDAYAYYYIDLVIGTPPQRVSVILDTGSGVCAFPCAGCSHCGNHIDPAFDFSKSSTAKWVPCGGDCVGRCTSGHCGYYQGYTEGSSISGYWFQDLVGLGDNIQHNPAVNARMGCHNNENNLFYTQKANGILGVGPSSRGNSLLASIFSDSQHVESRIMSICLAEWGGRLVIGGHNASYHKGTIQYVPLESRTGYYQVQLNGLFMDGQELSHRMGTTMVDSGTTYTYMGSDPYKKLRAAIENFCDGAGGCGATRSGKCWTITEGEAGLSRFPKVQLRFGSVYTDWTAQGYLYRRGTSKQWCYAFENDGPGANTVLGASWMIHQEIILDMKDGRMGIVPANCPEYKQRPEHSVDGGGTAASEATTLAPTTAVPTTTTPQPTTTTEAATTTTPQPTQAVTEAPVVTAAPTTRATTTEAPRTTTVAPTTTTPVAAVGQQGLDRAHTSGSGGGSGDAPGPSGGDRSTVLGAAVAVVALLAVAGVVAWRRFGDGSHKYVKQKDEHEHASGMPPQIVGHGSGAPGDESPSGDTFVIDDVDQWGEDEGFDFDNKAGGFAFGEDPLEGNKLVFSGRSALGSLREAGEGDLAGPASSAAFAFGGGAAAVGGGLGGSLGGGLGGSFDDFDFGGGGSAGSLGASAAAAGSGREAAAAGAARGAAAEAFDLDAAFDDAPGSAGAGAPPAFGGATGGGAAPSSLESQALD